MAKIELQPSIEVLMNMITLFESKSSPLAKLRSAERTRLANAQTTVADTPPLGPSMIHSPGRNLTIYGRVNIVQTADRVPISFVGGH
jgi:hypothetical protein